jgi:hypothetical protein
MGETQNKDRAVFKMLWPDRCWHTNHRQDWILGPDEEPCFDCNIDALSENDNPDFTTWEGFGLMWERAQEMRWWRDFIYSNYTDENFYDDQFDGMFRLAKGIHPTRFRDALYDYGVEAGLILGEAL